MSAYWLMELRVALRSLSKRPQFVATVILTLAFSMATVISIFSLNSLLLLQSLPYKDADKQYAVNLKLSFAGKTFPSLPVLQHRFIEQQTSFESIAMYIAETRTLELTQQTFKLETAFVSENYFEQLGSTFILGRGFNHQEQLGSYTPSTVISYHLWQEKFSGNPTIIGRQINIDGQFYTIIGILSEGVEAPENLSARQPTLYLPLDYSNADLVGTDKVSEGEASLIAKGLSNRSAIYTEEVQALSVALSKSINHPLLNLSTIKSEVIPLREAIIGNADELALLLLLGALMLLLVASANLANLFIARSVESRRNFAIHKAVGAKQKQLFNKLLMESSLLSLASGVMALLITVWGIELIKYIASDTLPRLNHLTIDGYTLFFSMVVCCVLALCFSYLPFWISKKSGLSQQMQSSGKGIGQQGSSFSRSALLIAQSSLVAMLLCFSSLFLQKSLSELNKVTGFETNNRTILTLETKNNKLSSGELAAALPTVISEIKQIPEISSVALSNSSPIVMAGVIFPVKKHIDSPEYMLSVNKVHNNFFDVLGVEFVAGSTFTNKQSAARYEVILNQSSTELLLGDQWSVGDTVIIAGRPYKLVGVIKDTFRPRYLRAQLGNELVILPYNDINGDMLPSEQIVLNIHHADSAHLNLSQIDAIVNTPSSAFQIKSLDSLQDMLEKEIYLAKTTAILAISFCLLTLGLAAIGVWGIVNYNAKTRRFEFGIRMAIGAKKQHLLKMMLVENAKPLTFGILCGVCIAVIIIQLNAIHFNLFGKLQLTYLVPMITAMAVTTFLAILKPVTNVVNDSPMQALKIET
ncbi:ABC transporter permease [Thalassotalea fusca]